MNISLHRKSPDNLPDREWRHGWGLALASASGVFLSAIPTYSAGVFFVPLEGAYGWSRSQISIGLTIFFVITVLGTPLVGALVDRFGPRRVGLPGAAIYLTSFGLLGLTGSNIINWFALWTIISVLALGTKPNIFAAAISSRFSQTRGVALGVMLIGASVAQGVMPAFAEFCIAQFGLKFAFAALSGITALVSLPLLWAFFFGATDLHRLNKDATCARPAIREALEPASIWKSALSLPFLKLVFAALAGSFVMSGFGAHLVPLLISKGIDPRSAAAMMAVAGVGSIGGRLACGWSMDHFNPPVTAALFFVLPIPGLILCAHLGGSASLAIVAIALLGFSLGAETDILAYLTSRVFPPEDFGRLFGIIISTLALGAAMGFQLASGIFDLTRSYDIMLYTGIPIIALGAAALAMLPQVERHQ